MKRKIQPDTLLNAHGGCQRKGNEHQLYPLMVLLLKVKLSINEEVYFDRHKQNIHGQYQILSA